MTFYYRLKHLRVIVSRFDDSFTVNNNTAVANAWSPSNYNYETPGARLPLMTQFMQNIADCFTFS
jgi:hypothetical protein